MKGWENDHQKQEAQSQETDLQEGRSVQQTRSRSKRCQGRLGIADLGTGCEYHVCDLQEVPSERNQGGMAEGGRGVEGINIDQLIREIPERRYEV